MLLVGSDQVGEQLGEGFGVSFSDPSWNNFSIRIILRQRQILVALGSCLQVVAMGALGWYVCLSEASHAEKVPVGPWDGLPVEATSFEAREPGMIKLVSWVDRELLQFVL